MKNRLAMCVVFACALIVPLASHAALKVGDMAPDFSLAATDGKTYKLADFRGNEVVVLAWFPKAYTSGCTIECKSLAQNGHLLKGYRMTYFMASVDPLVENQGFAKQQKADFPLLSDPTKATARAYGVLGAAGYAARQTFYVGVDGKIIAIDTQVNPATSAQDMAAKLAALSVTKRK